MMDFLTNVYERVAQGNYPNDAWYLVYDYEKYLHITAKKVGGVFYTPQYIVEYIVKNTIGKLIEGKTPNEIAALKICDPACGSGSFLLGAYQYLLDYHTDWYAQHYKKSRAAKDSPLTPDGNLTTPIKKEILLNNIYGVDIDTQAVEVTKLSLLIKCMEGETQASLQTTLTFERVLPTLENNIKSGNSLIDFDFYDGQIDFDPQVEKKVKPFNWKQAFPEVFRARKALSGTTDELQKELKAQFQRVVKTDEYAQNLIDRLTHLDEPDGLYETNAPIISSGGFDVVIGNPPYGAELSYDMQRYLLKKYPIGNTDTAALFMVFCAEQLLRQGGYNGFIIPKPFTYASNWEKTRQKLLPDITEIADCSKVWQEVKLEMVIYFLQKGCKSGFYHSNLRQGNEFVKMGDISKNLAQEFGFLINGIGTTEVQIAQKIKHHSISLNDVVINQRGAMLQKFLSKSGDYAVLGGKQIQRYAIAKSEKGQIGASFLKDNKAFLKSDAVLVQNIVAHISNPKPHIAIIASIAPQTAVKNTVILDTINQLTCSGVGNQLVVALLNSNLINWYAYRFIFANAVRTMHFDSTTTEKIPFPKISLKDKTQKLQHDEIVKNVDLLLKLNADLQTETDPAKKAQMQGRVAYAEQRIDEIVYQLYGLTGEEIQIIESQ